MNIRLIEFNKLFMCTLLKRPNSNPGACNSKVVSFPMLTHGSEGEIIIKNPLTPLIVYFFSCHYELYFKLLFMPANYFLGVRLYEY